MKKPPPGWPQISSGIFYREPLAAIDWLCKAFGFEVVIKIVGDDGTLHHSELRLGEGLIMVGAESPKKGDPNSAFWRSPKSLEGANTQSMMIYVDDVDALCARAAAAGAKVLSAPKDTDYGEDYWADRSCGLEDLEGHHWWIAQRLRNPKPR